MKKVHSKKETDLSTADVKAFNHKGHTILNTSKYPSENHFKNDQLVEINQAYTSSDKVDKTLRKSNDIGTKWKT